MSQSQIVLIDPSKVKPDSGILRNQKIVSVQIHFLTNVFRYLVPFGFATSL